jgi:hypothetical protein
MVQRWFLLLLAFSAAGCGSRIDPAHETASTGLKIFVSSRGHLADFVDDPNLHGTTGIARADDFCNTDANKPDHGTYKALLVDGVARDATLGKDWVLRPRTTYYQPHGDVVIGTTTDNAIFDAEYTPLKSAIGVTPTNVDPDTVDEVWTGIGNTIDFSTGNTCAGWSSTATTESGSRGVSDETSGSAFYAIGDYACSYFQLFVYCVEQP